MGVAPLKKPPNTYGLTVVHVSHLKPAISQQNEQLKDGCPVFGALPCIRLLVSAPSPLLTARN